MGAQCGDHTGSRQPLFITRQLDISNKKGILLQLNRIKMRHHFLDAMHTEPHTNVGRFEKLSTMCFALSLFAFEISPNFDETYNINLKECLIWRMGHFCFISPLSGRQSSRNAATITQRTVPQKWN